MFVQSLNQLLSNKPALGFLDILRRHTSEIAVNAVCICQTQTLKLIKKRTIIFSFRHPDLLSNVTQLKK
jgi:hypothetical protein